MPENDIGFKKDQVEDIFAETKAMPKVSPAPLKPEVEIEAPPAKKRISVLTIIMIVLGGIAIVLLIISGWFFWQKRKMPAGTNINSSILQDQKIVNVNSVNLNTNIPVNLNINTSLAPVYTDDDYDGLSNEAEAKYGTNPQKSDSDDDGLSDREEIKVYLTNPNNQDTDSDSYLDGAEVDGGYNPNGQGYLIDYQEELKKKLNINK